MQGVNLSVLRAIAPYLSSALLKQYGKLIAEKMADLAY
jgi:hypothetical protein